MKRKERQRTGKGGQPFTAPPEKRYTFPTPIPPCSIVRVKAARRNPWRTEVGRRFRIGYYSQMDGLDCIWLVNDKGEYEQTLDHEALARFFEIESISRERSRYGRNRPKFLAID